MRLARLDLSAYGHFTDRSIEFPSSTNDLHLVLGRNEAGKSTTLEAIDDLLFGIPHRSTRAFLHDNRNLRIGAALEHAGRRYEVVRNKGRGDKAFVDDNGQSLDPKLLAAMLAGISREQFQTGFCLNAERLKAGAEQLMNPDSVEGAVIFQAASGLQGLSKLRAELEEQAGELFKERGQKQSINVAKKEWDAADRELRAAEAVESQYTSARRALKRAEQARGSAKQAHRETSERLKKLNRVQNARVPLMNLGRIERDLDLLKDVPPMPSDAVEQVTTARQKIDRLTAQIETLSQNAEAAQKALRAAPEPDHALLQAAVQLEDLLEDIGGDRNLPDHLREAESEAAQMLGGILETAQELGWSEDVDQIRKRIPSGVQRKSLARLLKDYEQLAASLRQAERRLRDAEAVAEEAQTDLQALSPVAIPDAFLQVLRRSRTAADDAANTKRREKEIGVGQQELKDALAELTPFSGDVDALRRLSLPSEEDARQCASRANTLEDKISGSREEAAKWEREIASARAQIATLRKSGAVVTASDLTAAREQRDSLWKSIRSTGAIEPNAMGFEAAIVKADRVGDNLNDAADAAARLAGLETDLERCKEVLALAQKATAQYEADLRSLQEIWAERTASVGLAGISWIAFPKWMRARQHALSLASEIGSLIAAQTEAGTDADAVRMELYQQCRTVGVPHVEPDWDLSRLIEAAEAFRESQISTTGARETATRAVRNACHQLDQAKIELQNSQRDLTELSGRLDVISAEFGVSASDGASLIEAQLETVNELATRLQKLDELNSARISPMKDRLSALTSNVVSIGLGPAFNGDLFSWRVEAQSQLRTARDARDSREIKLKTAETANSKLAAARDELKQEQASLKSLYEAAGCQDDELDRLLKIASEARRKIDLKAEKDQQVTAIKSVDASMTLDELATEVAEFESEDLALLIQDAGDANDTAVEEVAAAERAWTEAQSEFARFNSSASAAAAMQRKSSHAAKMAEHASEFIRLRVASALLAAGLRQYQEVHQGPLLTRASAYFKDLTGERYDGLQLDQDAGKILAVKGRDLLEADALSDGTQSPLFLSLRLAAIEAQAEKGVLLPLIADDLFISMDDQRTLYALRALHRLSATTQIIYFGHELEIAEAATKELGGEMNIVRLDSGE